MIPMNTETIRDKVAAEVRAATARKGMSATELSRASGISTAALNRKMRGLVSFTVEELLSIADVTGTPADVLIQPAAVATEQVPA